MFGWLKKHERNEHLKMLKQNELAASYILDIQKTWVSSGMTTDDGLLQVLELGLFAIRTYQSDLKSFRIMPPERVSEQLEVNRSMRRLYDQILNGRRAFARQFGTSSEKLEKFDQKFCPNEGWRIYFSHYGESVEERFGS